MTMTESERVTKPARLGEELPIFCERCGYSLHGLPQVRCEACSVLQFHCPECGNHQPINTLRPAAQRIIGRLRAVWLVLVVFLKLNFFGWLLFLFGVLGYESSYRFRFEQPVVTAPGQSVRSPAARPTLNPVPISYEHFVVFGLLMLPFGMVSRMILLRWRQGWAVGLASAMLVASAMSVGVMLRGLDLNPPRLASIPQGYLAVLIYAASIACLGAIIVWPVWVAFVTVLLPSRTGAMLLEWQRAQSSREVESLARE